MALWRGFFIVVGFGNYKQTSSRGYQNRREFCLRRYKYRTSQNEGLIRRNSFSITRRFCQQGGRKSLEAVGSDTVAESRAKFFRIKHRIAIAMKIYSACMDESTSADAKSKNPCSRLCVHMRQCKQSSTKVTFFGDSSFLGGEKCCGRVANLSISQHFGFFKT